MNISNLQIGATVYFGRYFVDGPFEPTSDLQWVKISEDNEFMLVSRLPHLQFDEMEPLASSRNCRRHGCALYKASNIHQFLNASGDSYQWYIPAHNGDSPPPYQRLPGFLNQFTDKEIAAMMPRHLVCKTPPGYIRQLGKEYEMDAIVSLPSAIELGVTETDNEGSRFQYFEGLPRVQRPDGMVHRHNMIMTRTALSANSIAISSPYGGNYDYFASSPATVYPVIKLRGDLETSRVGENRIVKISETVNAEMESELFALLGI